MEEFIKEKSLPLERQKSIKPYFGLLGVIVLIIGAVIVWRYFTTRVPPKVPPTTTESIQPIAGKCLVLEEKYCSQAELVKWQHPRGETVEFVVFRLPAETPIFVPLPGDVATGGKSLVNPEAVAITIYNPADLDGNDPTVSMHGDIKLKPGMELTVPRQKGETLGVIGTKGITLFNRDYNFALSITRRDKERKVSVTDEMLKSIFFPANSL